MSIVGPKVCTWGRADCGLEKVNQPNTMGLVAYGSSSSSGILPRSTVHVRACVEEERTIVVVWSLLIAADIMSIV